LLHWIEWWYFCRHSIYRTGDTKLQSGKSWVIYFVGRVEKELKLSEVNRKSALSNYYAFHWYVHSAFFLASEWRSTQAWLQNLAPFHQWTSCLELQKYNRIYNGIYKILYNNESIWRWSSLEGNLPPVSFGFFCRIDRECLVCEQKVRAKNQSDLQTERKC
jgi:hypothetical protein